MAMNWTALLWFAAIVASIPLLLWLFKRSQMLGGHAAATGTPRAVAVLPLSASQKLVTVEVGRGEDKLWLVLGVTPSGIATLHTMTAPPPAAPTIPAAVDDPVPPHGPASATFAQLLGRLRGHGGGGNHGR